MKRPHEFDPRAFSTTGGPGRAPEARRARVETLVKLLADDSPVVLTGVRSAIEAAGRVARPCLRQAARSEQPAVRARARRLLLDEARRRAVRRLVRVACKAHLDLESTLFHLDRFGYPDEDLRPYARALDAMGDEVRRQLSRKAPGRERVLVLVDYLAGELGFAGAEEDFHHPDNIFLHRAIQRRRGMPLTLCAIYSAVADRAGLRSGLLPFPGHVLLRIRDGTDRSIIDPFGSGQVLSEEQCLSYLTTHGLVYRAEWFREASSCQMFQRHVSNLIHSYGARGLRREARLLELVQHVLGRNARVTAIF